MLLTLEPSANVRDIQGRLRGLGLWTEVLTSGDTAAIKVCQRSPPVDPDVLRRVPGVAAVFEQTSPHPRVDKQANCAARIAGRTLGIDIQLIAGPCSAEDESQVHAAAEIAARHGAAMLRGGAFKPRTSPYSFAGRGQEALGWLRDAADDHELLLVTEVMSERHVESVARVADMLQVGSRNMQNFALLRAIGQAKLPVMLKRGRAATLDEWLQAGEHLLHAGSETVVFCERGVAGVDASTRNMIDLGGVAMLKHTFGQPVIVDPSHAAGRRDLVAPLVRAALAVGADAVMVECHPDPSVALSDGAQALDNAAMSSVGDAVAKHRPPPRRRTGQEPHLAAVC